MGFRLTLQVHPRLTWIACRDIERGLQDYAEAHGLDLEGTQLRHVVTAVDRELSVEDQVALLDWLVDVPGVVGITCRALSGKAPAVRLQAGDLALVGLTLLYRLGRLSGQMYLDILQGPALVPASVPAKEETA